MFLQREDEQPDWKKVLKSDSSSQFLNADCLAGAPAFLFGADVESSLDVQAPILNFDMFEK
jgi:hypothetical protein